MSRCLLLLLTACSSSEVFQAVGECPLPQAPPPPQLLVVGKVATLKLKLVLPCQVPVNATSATTTVSGPDNRPVEHTASDVEGDSVTVTFTPQRAGGYHLTANLQPNLGIVQLDVAAALDFTEALVAHVMPRTDCLRFGVTASGAVLCDTGTQVYVARSGVEVQSIPGDVFAVRGDDVWVAGPLEATRWRDDGSGALEAVMPTLTLLEPPRVVLATSSGLLVVSDFGVRHYALVGSAFTSLNGWTYPGGKPVLAAYEADAGLLLRTDQVACRSTGAEAGALSCVSQTEPLLGASEGGVWVRAGRRAASLHVPGRFGPIVQVEAVEDSYWEENLWQGTGPHLSVAPYTLGWQDGEAVFVRWSRAPSQAIDGWVVFRTATGFELRRSSVR